MTITKGIYSKAELRASPNKGGAIVPDTIIVHDTAGALNTMGSVAWLCNPQARASAHFVIGRDGKIFQLVSCNVKAWHAGVSKLGDRSNVNDFSIGIEFVNPGHLAPSGTHESRASFGGIFDNKQYRIEARPALPSHPAGNWMPYTEAQLNAGLALCLDIRDAYNIQHLQPHWYISPGRKIDTNPLFPLVRFQGRIAGREDAHLQGILRKDALVRRWPTFFDSNNIFDHPEKVEILGKELHDIQGTDIPTALFGRRLEWTRIKFEETIAFVDPKDIVEI
jgi:N-acetylmuramoyl-L-alanine amidase